MNSNSNEVVIDIEKLMKELKPLSKSTDFFYCSKGLAEKLELKINNNSIFDNYSKQIMYVYTENLEPVKYHYFFKNYSKFYLIITLDETIKIEYEGNIFSNKLYHNGYFIIYLSELIKYCKSRIIHQNERYYEYYNIFISNSKTTVKSEITLDGNTNYYTSNPIVINEISYVNCLFEFYIYC